MKLKIYLISTFLCFNIGLHSQYPAEVLEYHTEISLKRNKLKTKVTKLIQINHTSADDFTDTYLHFSQGDDLKVHTVRIEDQYGKVLRELKKKEINVRSSVVQGALYTDDFVKYFKPKWHQYPYRIYYEYTHTVDDFLSLAYWSPITQINVPTVSASLSITLPKDYPVNMNYPDSIDFVKQEVGEENIFNWKVSNMEPPNVESYAPPLRSVLPFVLVFPEQFKYGLEGSQKTWNDYGKWQYKMNQGLRELPNSEKQKIDELVAGMSDSKEIVSTLYRYLQDNHRYILVSIETGGLKPYPASYVCEKRYGDCKALTNFMQAMLDYVKIPSFYVKVYAGDNPVTLKTDIPGQQFNHVILGVPLENDTIWLENTSNANPAGYLGTFTQNRKGLLVDPKESRLVNLPSLTADQPTQSSVFNFDLDKTGKGKLTVKTTATNQDFESLNYYQKNATSTKITRKINNYFPLKNATLLDYEFSEPDGIHPEIQLTTNWTTKKQYQKIGNRKVFAALPFSSFELEKAEERTQPVVLNYPLFETFEVNYKIPINENHKIEIPSPVEIDTPYGTLSVKAMMEDGMIKIMQKRRIKSGVYSLKEYPDLFKFIKSTEQISKKFMIVCTPKKS